MSGGISVYGGGGSGSGGGGVSGKYSNEYTTSAGQTVFNTLSVTPITVVNVIFVDGYLRLDLVSTTTIGVNQVTFANPFNQGQNVVIWFS